MYDFTGKNVCYVADCGGIALETCKVLMTKNIAVSTESFPNYKYIVRHLNKREQERAKKEQKRQIRKIFISVLLRLSVSK